MEIAHSTQAQILVISVIESGMPDHVTAYRKMMKDIRLLLEDHHISCECQLLVNHSTISKEILSFSNWVDNGCILLMTRNESSLSGHRIGINARQIIAQSVVPVQCVNPISPKCKSKEDSKTAFETKPFSKFVQMGSSINNQAETKR
jgi:hypothetical protein